MKIGYYQEKKDICIPELNAEQLKRNVAQLIEMDDFFAQYIVRIYNKYHPLIECANSQDVFFSLCKQIPDGIERIRCRDNFIDYDLIISASHEYTYHLVRSLNPLKKRICLICFDMHCDCYSTGNVLWKGNPFSHLLREGYITNFINIGMPSRKIEATTLYMSEDIRSQIDILEPSDDVLTYLSNIPAEAIFFSIDIDCFNTYENLYTAMDYCPFHILSALSTVFIPPESQSDMLKQIAYDSIFIRNNLGVANLLKIGEENYVTIDVLRKVMTSVKHYCLISGIKFGINTADRLIVSDITEVNGRDYNSNTSSLIVRIINLLKEVQE